MKLALLPLAALAASASAADVVGDAIVGLRAEHAARHLQDSIACIVGGQDPMSCCAGQTDDAICTLLTCVDLSTIAINEGCECSQLETACASVVAFDLIVPGIAGMCTQVTACCSPDPDDETDADNEDFNSCMGDAIESGAVTVPDFGGLNLGFPMGPGPAIEGTGATPAAGATDAPSGSCSFCPDGVGEPLFEIPGDAGMDCGSAQSYAATLAADDPMCATTKLAELLCCPPDDLPEIPDGLGPVLVDPPAATTTSTVPAVETTTAATEAAAPAPTPPPSSAGMPAAKTLALLAGSALAMAFV
ncbi:hypothetical protein ACHAXT_004186 [Thalassiosira profunda]